MKGNFFFLTLQKYVGALMWAYIHYEVASFYLF